LLAGGLAELLRLDLFAFLTAIFSTLNSKRLIERAMTSQATVNQCATGNHCQQPGHATVAQAP
jgi:hypothetical protein